MSKPGAIAKKDKSAPMTPVPENPDAIRGNWVWVSDAAASDPGGEGSVPVAVVSEMVHGLVGRVNDLSYLTRRVAYRGGGRQSGVTIRELNEANGPHNWLEIAAELGRAIDFIVTVIESTTSLMHDDILAKGHIVEEERKRIREMSGYVLDMDAYGKAGLIERPTERLSHIINNMVNAAASNLVYLQNPSPKGIVPDEIPF